MKGESGGRAGGGPQQRGEALDQLGREVEV
jgi:hypothetical protein